jgi:hypothetical protein
MNLFCDQFISKESAKEKLENNGLPASIKFNIETLTYEIFAINEDKYFGLKVDGKYGVEKTMLKALIIKIKPTATNLNW